MAKPAPASALYGRFHDYFEQLHGKELSYNNILDLTAAARIDRRISAVRNDACDSQAHESVRRWTGRKPCASLGGGLRNRQTAPFGGIIAVNRILDLDCARPLRKFQRSNCRSRFCRRRVGAAAEEKEPAPDASQKNPAEASALDVRSSAHNHSSCRSMIRER